MSIYLKNLIRISCIASLVGTINVIASNSAQAYSLSFSNGNFESSTDTLSNGTGWEGTGSTTIRGTYSGVDPFPNSPGNTRQGVITTGCPSTIQSGECLDVDGDGQPRNDDSPTAAGTYNLLGQDQISASPETADLQQELGLSANALSIFRTIDGVTYDGTNGNPVLRRTPKEGSAIFQDLTLDDNGSNITDFVFSFDWDFLTNDGSGDLGNKDFGFFSISGNGIEEVFVLEDSTGDISSLNSGDTNFATNTNTYATYTSEPLTLTNTAGTYRVGFGVVDADGVSYSSGLLVDNFTVEEVPFDFSPTAGLGLVAGIFGFTHLRRKLLHGSDVDN